MDSKSEGTASAPTSAVNSSVAISTVVCAYTDERGELLDGSIESILAQLGPRDELIVAIDYNDELFERVSEKYSGSRAKVIPNRNERGLCGARNAGVEASTGDVIAFVDDDAQIQPGWLERLRDNYRDPAVTGVGGKAQPVWPDERPDWFPVEFDWVVGCSYRGLPVETTQVRNLLGCNMSFRRDALDAIGGFNPQIGQVDGAMLRGDETELCIRLTQKAPNSVLILDPDLKVSHWVTEERTRFRYFLSRCFWEGFAKQRLSTMFGRSDALSTERSYVYNVLPMAFGRGLVRSVTTPGNRLGQLGQSAAIFIGLATTTYGYVHSLIKSRLGGHGR